MIRYRISSDPLNGRSVLFDGSTAQAESIREAAYINGEYDDGYRQELERFQSRDTTACFLPGPEGCYVLLRPGQYFTPDDKE